MAALDRALHVDRVVLIGLTGYGTDNSCLLEGLKKLGGEAAAPRLSMKRPPTKRWPRWIAPVVSASDSP